jgi:hypothetical protein
LALFDTVQQSLAREASVRLVHDCRQPLSLVPATSCHSQLSEFTPVAAASASVAWTWASTIVCAYWRVDSRVDA